jgi:septal ring factor EnvC (AmiA/AmiB activator)
MKGIYMLKSIKQNEKLRTVTANRNMLANRIRSLHDEIMTLEEQVIQLQASNDQLRKSVIDGQTSNNRLISAIDRYENSFLHIKSCLKDYNNDMDRAAHAKRFAINALDDIFIVKKEN